MVELAGVVLLGFLAQDVAASTAAFQAAIDAKRFGDAGNQVAPLVAKYAELGQLLAPKAPPKEPPPREAISAAKSDRKLIADVLEKAIRDPKLPAELQTKVLAQLDVRTDDGDKLLLKALQLPNIQEVPGSLAAAVRSLGSYRRTQHLDALEKQLGDSRAEVLKATASALGEFFGEKEATRKRIVEKLILAYSSAGSGFAKGATSRSLVDGDLVMEIRHDFQYALARLTGGVHFDRAKEWVEWWRDAKSAPMRDGIDRPNVKLDGLRPGPAPGH
jgi:hypothetical protein